MIARRGRGRDVPFGPNSGLRFECPRLDPLGRVARVRAPGSIPSPVSPSPARSALAAAPGPPGLSARVTKALSASPAAVSRVRAARARLDPPSPPARDLSAAEPAPLRSGHASAPLCASPKPGAQPSGMSSGQARQRPAQARRRASQGCAGPPLARLPMSPSPEPPSSPTGPRAGHIHKSKCLPFNPPTLYDTGNSPQLLALKATCTYSFTSYLL